MLIQRAQDADVEFIKEIEVESRLSSWAFAEYLQEIGREDSLFLVARENQEITGFVLARLIMYEDSLQKESSHFENEIEIYNIAVKREFRRRAAGSKLLRRIIEIGKKSNVKKIRLEVRKSNTGALKFYKKNFFEIDGERKNFYSAPLEDAILMTLRIS